MEWQDWLEKEDKEIKKKPTMFPRIRREFEDEKDEDPMVYDNKNDVNKIVGLIGAGAMATYKKLKEPSSEDSSIEVQDSGVSSSDVNKILGAIAGAVGGAAKVVGEAAGKVGGSVGRAVGDVASNPAVQEGVGNAVSAGTDKVDNLVEDVKNENQTGVSKAWELFLEKNNATETSHKEGEKKEEWNGKFDNSTTRDDAENDDDKAIGEEESLEELTDGKLEEVEKLKAWQIFLKGGGGTEEGLPHEEGEIAGKKNMHSLTGRYQNPTKHRKGHFANTITGKDAVEGTKKIPTSKVGTFQDTKNTKNLTENDVTAGAVRTAKKYPELKQYVPEAQVEEDKGLGGDTETPVKTQEELDKEFYERTQPEPKGTKSDKKVLARRKRKSWELWLEKGVTHEDPTKGVKGGMTKVPITQAETPDEIMEAANNPKTTIKLDAGMKKSWNEWLEKMQGAGDARYGNQHLTGMEQKPVADDESIDLSAESEENNEKQEKTEDKEDKDNKPYKALSQE